MTLSRSAYQILEAAVGRKFAWRLGRWLYQGSRRELSNDPDTNGEYLLQRAWAKARAAEGALEGGHRIVDVGANVGAWTANMLNELRAASVEAYNIWAFEPAETQRSVLSNLCAAEVASGAVRVDPRGLAAVSGRARFNVTGELSGSSALATGGQETAGTIEIVITTLDAACHEAGIGRLDLVKVDTEGNDFNVILGAKGLFDREAIDILQFEYNWRWVAFGHSLHEVFEFFDGRPYEIGRLTPEGLELYAAWHPELERYIETNYAIVRNVAIGGLPHWRCAFDGSNTPVRLTP